MSDATQPTTRRRHRIWWVAAVVLLVIVAAVVGGAAWYATTPAFENLVRNKVIAEIETATGGRVELGSFHWQLLRLKFVADDLTVHGLEGAGQVPYAHVDRLYVRVRIISFFRREVALNYLEADHPVIHLIVFPDGSTNQPHPKVASTSSKSAIDTIFDLKVGRAELRDGVAIVNEKSIPFNATANKVTATVTYIPATGLHGRDRYHGWAHLEDLVTERGKEAPVHSTIDAQVELGRNQLTLQSFDLKTGSSHLVAGGTVVNFADPVWKLKMNGAVELGEIEALSDVPGLNRGQVQLDIQGNGTRTAFTADGHAKISGASYHTGTVHLVGVSAETDLHLTQDDLLLSNARARLAQGGYIDGQMEITQWMKTAPPAAVPPLPPSSKRAANKAKAVVQAANVQRGTVRAKLHGISLATIMAIVAPQHYTELGFDTEASGDATVDWAGDPDAFVTGAKVTLTPPLKLSPNRVPLYGTVDAQYSNVSGTVTIRSLDVHTPASEVQVAGLLGVYPITRASKLQVRLTTANLSEFDQTMTTLGVTSGGKKGVKALPITLNGQADFTGTITNSILTPDVKGHVNASDVDLAFTLPEKAAVAAEETAQIPEQEPAIEQTHTVHWDSIHADAEYASDRIAVARAELTHGPAAIQLSGELNAHELSRHRTEFDEYSGIHANVSVQDASVEDLLHMAGQDVPVTGTLNVTAQVDGTLNNLNGGGHVSVSDGMAYGEKYESAAADLNFIGSEVDAKNLVFLADGGKVTGDGGYDMKAATFHFDARGDGFTLEKIKQLQKGKYTLAGALNFTAHGSGTVDSPQIQANAHLTQFNFDNAATGNIDADAHTQGQTLLLSANAHMTNVKAQVSAQVQLAGDYQTRAQLTVSNFDAGPVLSKFNVQGLTMHSEIGATVNVSGPLRTPSKLTGDATVQQFAVSVAGVALESDGPLHASLVNGRLHLDPLHITGEDTNLRAQGSIGALTEVHDLNLHANGSVNMRLVQTLDSDLTAAGHVDFNVDAGGILMHPSLTGDVKFTNVSVALQDFPNGLTKINGTLEFDQDRLDVKSVTAVSGGGQLTLGGFVTYQQGLYGDLTATANGVRIRYPQGISSMVNAKLRLQGTQKGSLLSGNVTVTRFVIGSDLDLTSLSSPAGVTLPPNPNAPSNHVRLDVHVMSAPQLDFQNSYAKLAGDVDLRVRGTVAQPTVLGHISITEGNATFAGTKYELQHGDIYFSNPIRIDPTLDLSATAHVEDYDITIGLTGTPSKPVTTFRSEPPLAEQDIFSLLALGRTQEEQQIYSNMQSQAGGNATADALLGGALNATVSSRVQKLFGGGSVKIDPTYVTGTGNASARITVQQQVSKNATLTYATNVNSTAQQLIQAQWNFTQNWSVVAVRDESGVFSLLFKLRKRYK